MLESYGEAITAVVVGASGGIGRAFVEALATDDTVDRVYAFSRSNIGFASDKIISGSIDIDKEETIKAAAQSIEGAPRLVLVATGILHDKENGLEPEKSWRALSGDSFHKVFAINTVGPALVGKHFLPLLPREGKSTFAAISARVGSITDNGKGGWHAYRASKAALNMLIKNFAIELGMKRKEAVCIGLHPGTVDTRISEPFQSNVPEDQLFSPGYSAARLLEVVDGIGADRSGRCFDYAAKEIPA